MLLSDCKPFQWYFVPNAKLGNASSTIRHTVKLEFAVPTSIGAINVVLKSSMNERAKVTSISLNADENRAANEAVSPA